MSSNSIVIKKGSPLIVDGNLTCDELTIEPGAEMIFKAYAEVTAQVANVDGGTIRGAEGTRGADGVNGEPDSGAHGGNGANGIAPPNAVCKFGALNAGELTVEIIGGAGGNGGAGGSGEPSNTGPGGPGGTGGDGGNGSGGSIVTIYYGTISPGYSQNVKTETGLRGRGAPGGAGGYGQPDGQHGQKGRDGENGGYAGVVYFKPLN